MGDIVERLRREVPHCEDPSDYSESDLLIMSAANEIERLREALRKISNMGQTNVPDHWDFRVKAREIAHAALREKE